MPSPSFPSRRSAGLFPFAQRPHRKPTTISLPLIASFLLLPFLLVSLRATDVRKRIETPSSPPLQSLQPLQPLQHPSSHLPSRSAFTSSLAPPKAASPPLLLPPPDPQLLIPPDQRSINGNRVFVPNDVNNPTKIPVPPNGFPPLDLPAAHSDRPLLTAIRKQTNLKPRWPKHPGLNVPHLRSYGPAYSSIIISHKLNVVFVPVFKVATTSTMWHIAYLENNPGIIRPQLLNDPVELDIALHDMGRPAWQNHTVWSLTNQQLRHVFEDPTYLKFSFVRNPFDRIISAFVDKILNFPHTSLEYQHQMYALFGNDDKLRAQYNRTKPTFPQFIHFIAEVLSMPRAASTDLTKEGAFEDNMSRRDMHWRPQVELLHPDLIHLDFVGRFDNLTSHRNVVLEWMYRNTDRRMPRDQGKLHSTDPEEKVQLYNAIKQDPSLRDAIIRIYEKDFDTFQFSRELPDLYT